MTVVVLRSILEMSSIRICDPIPACRRHTRQCIVHPELRIECRTWSKRIALPGSPPDLYLATGGEEIDRRHGDGRRHGAVFSTSATGKTPNRAASGNPV